MRKVCLVKSRIFMTKRFVWESRIPRSILVQDLCGIEVCIASLRHRMQISIEGKSWTRMECGIFVPRQALYSYFPYFLIYKMTDITKQNFLI